MFKKRGISPLIATVLIIGFTVALAAVIMVWGQSFSKSMQESTEQSTKIQLICSQDVLFEISSACYDSDHNLVKITVKNNGNQAIESFRARLFKSDNEVEAPELSGPLDPFAIKTFEASPKTFGVDKIEKVELIPVIKVNDKEITCPNTIDDFSDLAPC